MTVYQIDHKEFKRNLKKIDANIQVRYIRSGCGNYVYCTIGETDRVYKIVVFDASYVNVYHRANTAYITIDNNLYVLGTLIPAERKVQAPLNTKSTFIDKQGMLGTVSDKLGDVFVCILGMREYTIDDIIDEAYETTTYITVSDAAVNFVVICEALFLLGILFMAYLAFYQYL